MSKRRAFHSGGIAILDYGSQYTQLIARRLREQRIYSEIFAPNAPESEVLASAPRGIILSGSPYSVYEAGAPQLPAYLRTLELPILGICYGMQLLAHSFGGAVSGAAQREYGAATVAIVPCPLFRDLPEQLVVWMSHADRIEKLPEGWQALGSTPNAPYAAMGDLSKRRYAVQFHPEVTHTPHGAAILRNFAVHVCGCTPDWTPKAIIEESVAALRAQIGAERVILGLSGGVDSAVAAALLQRAVGDQLTCIFINTGLLRQGEPEQVIQTFQRERHMRLVAVEATEEFLAALAGVTEPEQKRTIIGEKFIRTFEAEARKLGQVRFLAQGTIYPDVIESGGGPGSAARTIKKHHNVGGLPPDLAFELVEPLRYLFKDEVRQIGTELSLPDSLVWRQPFPGPGLAVRCLGEVTFERLARLRAADAIVLEELGRANLLRGETAQAFAVLLPVRSVGVMGDGRTYQETIAVRAVQTEDFMTAQWARLPYEVLARISERIVNEVQGVNRVVYDITTKPPATVEWE
ncbi:MAG: GMP synthase (glutamine-hydrolyzing) [Candidatus Thermofonsia Clade 1 bacterium]|uniref:GMP synthase [glutamine-hydrolyzing] n=1 Tax=Candidatus Thermofonsia Clade 1 bacterium TaxID=2364210 RepID=A0A2M8PF21_9CHLR|nr:MAG: GMP synthase (glutamine-hydrolyzing) [Candidatus Thermofonsia Clade 1 bacterium]